MVGPTGLVWEKYPSKKTAEMWFHRLRRKVTRLAGYTVVAFLSLKFLVRILMTRTMLDSVTEKIEQMIFGALQKDFCPAPISTDQEVENIIYKSRLPHIPLDPDKFLLPILAQGAQGMSLRNSFRLSFLCIFWVFFLSFFWVFSEFFLSFFWVFSEFFLSFFWVFFSGKKSIHGGKNCQLKFLSTDFSVTMIFQHWESVLVKVYQYWYANTDIFP